MTIPQLADFFFAHLGMIALLTILGSIVVVCFYLMATEQNMLEVDEAGNWKINDYFGENK